MPEFVDIDEETYNMSIEQLREFLEEQCTWNKWGKLISRRSGRRVTAVVPVHLYGQMADMDAILELGDQYDLTVIEDACQAHGAEYFSPKNNRWMKAGSMGRQARSASIRGRTWEPVGKLERSPRMMPIFPPKSGCCVTTDRRRSTTTTSKATTDGLDAIQAGLLNTKLAHLTNWNLQRRDRAALYNRLLAGNQGLGLPYEPSWSRAVYHLYVVRTNRRDDLIAHLREADIGTGIHYPMPLHLQKAYAFLKYGPEDFPVAARVAAQIVSLPMFPQLTEDQQARVAEEVRIFTSKVPSKPAEGEGNLLEPAEQTA